MLLDFFYELRRRKVPVSIHEWLALTRALELNLHGSSLTGFYELSRSLMVKQLGHFDAFDAAFLAVFHGLEADALAITSELAKWLAEAKERGLSDDERAFFESLSPDELRQLYEQRLQEQKERHDFGSKWIGTAGTSPFGRGGQNPNGMAVGGGARTAMQRAGERAYRAYRTDVVLDVRKIDVALRLLRELGREGAEEELDLDASIDHTAKNAGELELVYQPPRRNRAKVVLLMDVGGSMDPHAELCSRLFTAASRAGRFARFRSFYFHNCVYSAVYHDASLRRGVPVADLLATSDRDEKLVVVGDAAMHPGELLASAGAYWSEHATRKSGLEWMRLVREHFRKAAWLNPEPENWWSQTTVAQLRRLYPMFPLTEDGLSRAVRHLVRGAA